MAKLTIPQLKSSSFKGWAFVLVAGCVLTVLALFDRGGTGALLPNQADGSTGCTLTVTTEELNVRSGPSQNAELLGSLRQGEQVDGMPVVTDGFRQLEGDRWASDQYLTPVAGTVCR
ncbi:SH3 domain-containing protein [Pseudonocardia lacus]|uniref:SH3 domain-containing protein n=1 Tax=Pseudonocardia lacus TaxID=2835865 RepID=UPI001BDBCC51|nr:SH3 domain-containing protein [Pseudonocardia lacus]